MGHKTGHAKGAGRSLEQVVVGLGMTALGALLLPACDFGETSNAVVPRYWVRVRGDGAWNGYGCGAGPGETYRFFAVLRGRSDGAASGSSDASTPVSVAPPATPTAGSTAPPSALGTLDGGPGNGVVQGSPLAETWFDCFSDGIFVNVPLTGPGSRSYRLAVYGFSRSDYERWLERRGGFPSASSQSLEPEVSRAARWVTQCEASLPAAGDAVAACLPLASNPTFAGNEGGSTSGTPDGGLGDGGPPDASLTDGSDGAPGTPPTTGPSDGGPTADGGATDASPSNDR